MMEIGSHTQRERDTFALNTNEITMVSVLTSSALFTAPNAFATTLYCVKWIFESQTYTPVQLKTEQQKQSSVNIKRRIEYSIVCTYLKWHAERV